jgi:UDP-N-acetylmuramate--alanine ligase
MSSEDSISKIKGLPVHFVGIKGTGMCALAEVYQHFGARISGSDVPEEFYTDAILADLAIPVREGFSADHIGRDTALVVYSAAYDPQENEELVQARRLGIPLRSYPQALGALSRGTAAAAIAGVHGKTSTTALSGVLAKASGLPATVVAGSGVSDFGGHSAWSGGTDYLIAETCEYRRHFLHFHAKQLLVTSIEADHLDYFKNEAGVHEAFFEYGMQIETGGSLVYCADDPGAVQLAENLSAQRRDLRFVPYGEHAAGPYRIVSREVSDERQLFSLEGFDARFSLSLPGRHYVLNAAGAIALIDEMTAAQQDGSRGSCYASALAAFRGCTRRSERLGGAGGVLFMDDYAHHPTAVRKTLAGYREFFPRRRIIVDFMSHTYSRTRALLEDFADAFADADKVILHKIYASAREAGSREVTGKTLYEAVSRTQPNVRYFPEIMDAYPYCREVLQAGDLFVTMGAGNNWTLGRRLFEEMRKEEGDPA